MEEVKNESMPETEVVKEEKEVNALAEEYYGQLQRVMADFDNYRKRQAQEREGLINYGKIEAFTKLLEVFD